MSETARVAVRRLKEITHGVALGDVLRFLKDLDVYKIENETPNAQPLPMFFEEGWGETFDALIAADRVEHGQ